MGPDSIFTSGSVDDILSLLDALLSYEFESDDVTDDEYEAYGLDSPTVDRSIVLYLEIPRYVFCGAIVE